MWRGASANSARSASGPNSACARSRHSGGASSLANRNPTPPATATRDHHVPGGSGRGWRISANPRKPNATGAIAAAVALASGWPENGSVNGATSSHTRAAVAVESLQWIGANREPRRWPASNTTLSTQAPWCVVTRANPSGLRPADSPSAGCTATKGSGQWAASRGLAPLRVIVCHWSRTRPVLRRNGYAASTLDLSTGGSGAMNCARRSGVKKPPAAKKRIAPFPAAGTGHCTGSSAS